MKTLLQFNFEADKANNQIHLSRAFLAGKDLVWDAWTKPELLDQWWAPKPYQTKTKSMDFSDGGRWLYCMVSPSNEVHCCCADYSNIKPQNSYQALDAFCDEEGILNPAFPRANWSVTFHAEEQQTLVKITITYEQLSDLEKIIELGFKEGFTMAMENLDQYLEAQGNVF
jgi:uncharacterized protein YndB with AHSA1/START domain